MTNYFTKMLVLTGVLLSSAFALQAHAATTTTTVYPSDMATSTSDVIAHPTKWLYYNDETNVVDPTLGSFVAGPGTPLLGTGSVQISVSGTQRRNLATYQFAGTKLSDITVLKYSTYNPSAGNGGPSTRSAYLHFNVSFDGVDSWQRRLVHVPSVNDSVTQNVWKEWDALKGGTALWLYSGPTWPGTTTPGTTARTWNDILAQYPNAQIRATDSFLGLRVGEPYADGYTENIDTFTLGSSTTVKVFNFDPAPVVLPGALAAEDFGVVNYDTGLGILKGYTAGFGLTDATLSTTTSVVVKLYSGTTLLQTNTAIYPAFSNLAGAQFSSPFDVSGTFDYVTDGYWTNVREAQYGQSLPATRVVATVTLANGKVVTAENTTLSGDPTTIYPPVVVPVTISSVAAQSDINVAYGTALGSVGLPTMVTVNLSGTTTATTLVAVTWDGGTPAYNGSTTGTYEFTGTLTLPTGVTNPDNLKAHIEVNVGAAPPVLTLPANKEECKKGGWATFTGRIFKNQGDCVSSVQAGR